MYCAPADLFAFGLPRGSTPNPGRVLSSAVGSVCALDVHGFITGDPVLLRPAGDGAMPTGLSAGVTYFVELTTEHTFRLRATAGGSAITWTDAVDPLIVISPLPVDAAISWGEQIVNNSLPAHMIPLIAPIPEIVKMTVAELAAGKLLALSGSASVSLSKTVDDAIARLARWSKGVPLRGPDGPPRTNLAVSATRPYCDRRGWNRFGGL